ncbi:hypothetical protein N7456_005534 [Penicillium angulare]|uniref:Uncharacterized protein n=1 Tax=Penicillium angulare TaxID=116970 RepID=A0A9W9FYQ1_9EURO|nr:hypothetical protein N7456_005534 [Penicillium angulare]
MCFGFSELKPQPPSRAAYGEDGYSQYLRDYNAYQKAVHGYNTNKKKRKARRPNHTAALAGSGVVHAGYVSGTGC